MLVIVIKTWYNIISEKQKRLTNTEVTKMKNQNRINGLFRQMVPAEGPAATVGGELVRAVCRIGYRFFNDGDRVGFYAGCPDVSPAARFIRDHGDEAVREAVTGMWNDLPNPGGYEGWIDELAGAVADYVENAPGADEPLTEGFEASRRDCDGQWWLFMDDEEFDDFVERHAAEAEW